MGQGQSIFEEDQLEQYQDCTYFSKKEILRVYKRFSALNPEKINPKKADTTTRLSFTELQSIAELRENPFKDRICEVFSTGSQGLHFEDCLDLFSVFSERAPWDLKATYAFRIYDFNNDAAICRSDMEQVIRRLTGDSLDEAELATTAAGVLQESDMAHHHRLSYTEFEHVIARAPDFINLFHMTV